MNKLLIVLMAAFSLSAFAQTPASCEAQAGEKKLAGAAKTAFVKKCERESGAATPDANKAACEKTAAEKKLAGAAKNSFVKKCEKDAVAK